MIDLVSLPLADFLRHLDLEPEEQHNLRLCNELAEKIVGHLGHKLKRHYCCKVCVVRMRLPHFRICPFEELIGGNRMEELDKAIGDCTNLANSLLCWHGELEKGSFEVGPGSAILDECLEEVVELGGWNFAKFCNAESSPLGQIISELRQEMEKTEMLVKTCKHDYNTHQIALAKSKSSFDVELSRLQKGDVAALLGELEQYHFDSELLLPTLVLNPAKRPVRLDDLFPEVVVPSSGTRIRAISDIHLYLCTILASKRGEFEEICSKNG